MTNPVLGICVDHRNRVWVVAKLSHMELGVLRDQLKRDITGDRA